MPPPLASHAAIIAPDPLTTADGEIDLVPLIVPEKQAEQLQIVLHDGMRAIASDPSYVRAVAPPQCGTNLRSKIAAPEVFDQTADGRRGSMPTVDQSAHLQRSEWQPQRVEVMQNGDKAPPPFSRGRAVLAELSVRDGTLYSRERESDHPFVGTFSPQPRDARSRGRARLAGLPRLRLKKLVQSRMEFDMRVTLRVTKTIWAKDYRQDRDLPSPGYR